MNARRPRQRTSVWIRFELHASTMWNGRWRGVLCIMGLRTRDEHGLRTSQYSPCLAMILALIISIQIAYTSTAHFFAVLSSWCDMFQGS